jgi:hypothetical protein
MIIEEEKEESGVRRTIWMPRKLDHIVEQTRKAIGYTRSGFYRYTATKTIEQTLLTQRKEIKLQPWDEIIGTLKTIENAEDTITAVIECYQSIEMVLHYPKDSLEAVAIQNSNGLLGQRIALLKTDNTEKPINIEAKPRVPSKIFVRIGCFVKGVPLFSALCVSLKMGCF